MGMGILSAVVWTVWCKKDKKKLKMAQVILDNLTNSKASAQSKMDSELVSRGDNIKQSHRLNPRWVS
jgi:hypothetical protein